MVGRVTGVVFDLDGTLYRLRYDVDALRRAWSVRCGVPPGTVANMLAAMTQIDRAAALAELAAAEHAGVADGPAMPGAAEALSRLRELVPVAVVSRNERAAVLAALDALGHGDLAVVARGEAAAEKPDGAPVLAACTAIGTEPCSTLVVGDTSHDVAAAAAGGAHSVVVRNVDVPRCPDGADAYVADLAGVVAYVEALAS